MSFIIPIGPYHPMLKEPEYFKVVVDGEEVVDVEIKIGYNHRGIEKLMEERDFFRNIFLAERVCGICSGIHTVTYVQTVESLVGLDVPGRAKYLRMLMLELERLHSHLLWMGVAMHLIGFDTLFMHIWKDREVVMDALELLTGNRVNYGFCTIGGVRRDLDERCARAIRQCLSEVESSLRKIAQAASEDPVLKARMVGVGLLHREEAKKYCVVGPTARGSGLEIDVRRDDPYAAYDEVEWEVCVEDKGDVYARFLVRLRECFESVRIGRQALDKMPAGEICVEVEEFPEGEAVGRGEAPRGELIYYVRSNGTSRPERVRIRTPSFVNNAALPVMLIGGSLADVPIVVGSIDPCYSCTDRVVVVDRRTGSSRVLTFEQLRRCKKLV